MKNPLFKPPTELDRAEFPVLIKYTTLLLNEVEGFTQSETDNETPLSSVCPMLSAEELSSEIRPIP